MAKTVSLAKHVIKIEKKKMKKKNCDHHATSVFSSQFGIVIPFVPI